MSHRTTFRSGLPLAVLLCTAVPDAKDLSSKAGRSLKRLID